MRQNGRVAIEPDIKDWTWVLDEACPECGFDSAGVDVESLGGSVRTNADPNDKRTDRIYGEVGFLGMFIPGWGMHLADMAEAQGDLVRRVEALGSK